MDAIERHAENLREAVRRRYADWCQDQEMFFKRYPGVTIELPAGRRSPAEELRAVAATVMERSGLDGQSIDGSGIFSIGVYDGPGGAI
ncbi:hypothetical protein HAP48_0027545 [Bradyrhizobium septentrionale]|uniref:Uncharacterized protein n=1 Tax=Bradyrhizobium septentrionale TaxID=1404411 RepID=A0A974A0U9_9BRAD|nr:MULTISPECIES: hypothetical protein [Bradyrhizobium]UGY12397.1 hypothetical protein HAP48_0027545 [Bradyrhizobium septentrionale]UGY25451.1 hypothetical protein HU675_0000390 [Bradyrhizobium septentrionale]